MAGGHPIANGLEAAVRPSGRRAPRRRWMIAGLLGLGVLVNYFDRVNISVSQDALYRSFGVGTVMFGVLSSAYSWTYAAMQLPSGVLLDRFGVKRIGRISSFLWSMACFGGSAAPGVGTFFSSRLLLGIGEAPTFPASAKAVGHWFPERERSLATALFDAASKFGPAVGVLWIGAVLVHFGWRSSFAATGMISLLYFALFYWVYRNPAEDQALDPVERRLIAEGGGEPERAEQGAGDETASLFYLLGQQKAVGLTIGFAAYNYTFYLLLSWLPSYLEHQLHLNMARSVAYTSVPWMIGTLTDIFIGGLLVNALIHRGWDASRVRQAVLVGGTTLGLGIIGAAHARTPGMAVFWISVSLGGLAAAGPVGWSVPSLIAPREAVGKMGGILNFGNQLSAIAAPIATGFLVKATHSFAWAFGAAAIFLVIGIASYIFLLGRIEPIPAPETNARQRAG